MVTSLQGHDLVPREILVSDPSTARIFKDYLPGYSVDGIYNFVTTGDNPAAALQLNKLLHSGEHSWLNDALKELLTDFEEIVPEADRPKRLAGLVNFLAEASDPDSNPNGIKTGGISHRSAADNSHFENFLINVGSLAFVQPRSDTQMQREDHE